MFGDVAFSQAPYASLGGATYLTSIQEAANAAALFDVASLTKGGPVHEAASASATQNVISALLARVNESGVASDTITVQSAFFVNISEATSALAVSNAVAAFLADVSEGASGAAIANVSSEFFVDLLEAASGHSDFYGVKGIYGVVEESAAVASETNVPRVIWSGLVSEAASAVDEMSVVKAIVAYPTGIQLFVTIGDVLIWATIDDSQTANWQNITNTQSPVWAALSDSQSPSWTAVGTVQSASWTDIDDTQSPDWNNIPS